MAGCRRILAAADLRKDGGRVIEFSATLALALGADLHVAHVVEPMPSVCVGEGANALKIVHVGERGEAHMRLLEAAGALEVPAERCHVVEGYAASEIRKLANGLGVDLVVIGARGRHGLEFAMGSTSNAVLHDSAFDVLALRL